MTVSRQVILLAVETESIQKYIFNSNRLAENIGASHLVASATGAWAFDAVQAVVSDSGGQHNIAPDGFTLDDSITIEQPTTAAEVLYSGGGNFVVLFRDDAIAKAFTQQLSRRALTQAPGLRLIIYYTHFDLHGEPLSAAFTRLHGDKKRRRSQQPNVMRLAGLGVTVMCQSTALPAVGFDTRDNVSKPQSAEVLAKIAAAPDANKNLEKLLPAESDMTFPRELDDLGRTRGESSMLAVVHADGDGVGKKIQAIGEKYPKAQQYRAHITELRDFSRRLEQATRAALDGTIQQLQQAFAQSREFAELFVKKDESNQKLYLPFRPLVFGGDDVTFVSDGRIGLALTLEYLRRFQAESSELLQEPMTACAGVAIVKAHYPFARAYELAEDLSKEAKQYRKKHAPNSCCIDWHFTTGGIFGSVGEIREREYSVSAGSLNLRPVNIDGDGMHSWNTIEAGLTVFQREEWHDKRNKTKLLREVLRGGREAVAEFETLYKLTLPQLAGFEHGWGVENDKHYCGYFDAIELMDLYTPIRYEEEAHEPHA